MFGVNLMVHSWVTSNSSSVPAINKSALFKSGRASQPRASAVHNWKIARSLFFLFAFLLLFSGFTLVHTFASSDELLPSTSEEIVISVDNGDTLWQIARNHKKDSIDTRQAVHYILERNGLSSSAVKSGQTLILPTRILP